MSINNANASGSMPDLSLHPQLDQPTPSEDHPVLKDNKAVVVGLYGVSGCGKTTLMNQLKQELGQEQFAFYEGSEMIGKLVPSGLEAFKKFNDQDKTVWRERAITEIGKTCTKVAIVTGHFMFWHEEGTVGETVLTSTDLDIFTHILYLDVPADDLERQTVEDKERSRQHISTAHVRIWQQEEKTQLRRLCRANHILFSVVSPNSRRLALNMLHRKVLETNCVAQEFGRQIPSDTTMGFPQDWTGNRGIARWRHE